MKKTLTFILSLICAFGLFVGCGGGNQSSSQQSSSEYSSVEDSSEDSSVDDTETKLEAVKQALLALYPAEGNTWDGKEALTRPGSIAIEDESYAITWELVIATEDNVDNCVVLTKQDDNSYQVTVDEAATRSEDIAFTLKATISDSEENTKEVTFAYLLTDNAEEKAEEQAETNLEAVKQALIALYPATASTWDGKAALQRIGTFAIGELEYTITWALVIDSAANIDNCVALAKQNDGSYQVTVKPTTLRSADIPFSLKATIADSENRSKEVTFEHVLEKDGLEAAKTQLLTQYPNEVLELGAQKNLVGKITVSGKTYTITWSFTSTAASAVDFKQNENGSYTLKIKTGDEAWFDNAVSVSVKAVISNGVNSIEATVTYTLERNTYGPY